uniref:ABC transporter permease n=1 Tax=uncultured Sphingomonas sp. TaxID=158754 RepID=UPI00345B2EE1
MRLGALLRSAFVIGRRDFTATVFSKAFLFFLLGPLFPLLIVLLFGGIGANVAREAERPTVAVIATAADFARLEQAHSALERGLRGVPLVRLRRFDPDRDLAEQARGLLASSSPPVTAVLSGLPAQPRLTGAVRSGDQIHAQVELLLTQARAAPGSPVAVETMARASGSTASARALTAHGGQALLFLLTLLLAGMLLSQLIEEKSNKVIEVLAAAVPVEAIFLGKLFAMLAMSLLGITVWATAALTGLTLLASPGAMEALPPPALGWPAFAILAVIYFAAAYLLIGAAFLGIGAQASTVREVQTLSMPVTMAQVVIFALATAAAADMDSPAGLAAAAFPLSSPYAMIARAAQDGAWWPHLLALLWQALWIAVILRFAAGLFRRSVLKSGPQRRRWWRRAVEAS